MGMYIFITEQDRITKRKVDEPVLNELFHLALREDKSLMIDAYTKQTKVITCWPFYKKVKETRYNIYHECTALDGSPYQARFQSSASGTMSTVVTYLHGIINGSLVCMRSKNNSYVR